MRKNLITRTFIILCIFFPSLILAGQKCRRLHQVYRGIPLQLLPQNGCETNLYQNECPPYQYQPYQPFAPQSRCGLNGRCSRFQPGLPGPGFSGYPTPTYGYPTPAYGSPPPPFLDPIPEHRYWRYYYHPWRRFPWYRPHGIHLQYYW